MQQTLSAGHVAIGDGLLDGHAQHGGTRVGNPFGHGFRAVALSPKRAFYVPFGLSGVFDELFGIVVAPGRQSREHIGGGAVFPKTPGIVLIALVFPGFQHIASVKLPDAHVK
ncbi:hypothetical protein ACQRA4_06825 [Desulfovibrio sp. SGI.169]